MRNAPDANQTENSHQMEPLGCGSFLLKGTDLPTWAAEVKPYDERIMYLYGIIYGEGDWGDASTLLHLLDLYAANLMEKIQSAPVAGPFNARPSPNLAALLSLFGETVWLPMFPIILSTHRFESTWYVQ